MQKIIRFFVFPSLGFAASTQAMRSSVKSMLKLSRSAGVVALFAAMLATTFTSTAAHARTLIDPPKYIEEQGPVVAIPSRIIGNIFVGIGAAVAGPFTGFSVPYAFLSGDDPFVEFGATLAVGAIAAGEVGYHLGAAPSYVVQTVGYTGPKYAIDYVWDDAAHSGVIAELEPERNRGDERLFAWVPVIGPKNYSGEINQVQDTGPQEDEFLVIDTGEYADAAPTQSEDVSVDAAADASEQAVASDAAAPAPTQATEDELVSEAETGDTVEQAAPATEGPEVASDN